MTAVDVVESRVIGPITLAIINFKVYIGWCPEDGDVLGQPLRKLLKIICNEEQEELCRDTEEQTVTKRVLKLKRDM